MRGFYNTDFKIRGFRKTKDWVGWTDGLSIITGTKIPFTVLPHNCYAYITKKDILFELGREYVAFGKEPDISLIKTPIASAVINELGFVLGHTRLDYYDIMFNFGLIKTHRITFGLTNRIHIYNTENRFVGFFALYNHRIWTEMLGVHIHYAEVFGKLNEDDKWA